MTNPAFSFDCDVNQFPSLTWNHLNINREHLSASAQVAAGKKTGSSGSAIPEGISVERKKPADLPPALSGMKTGMGKAFDAQFDDAADKLCLEADVYTVREAVQCDMAVHLPLEGGDGIRDIVIVARKGSGSSFIFETGGDDGSFAGNRIRILAEEGAKVHVALINLLGGDVMHFDSVGAAIGQGAKLELTELQLGGSKVFSGSCYELSGEFSSFEGRLAYLVDKKRSLDVNYVARQTGRNSSSSMMVDGVVSGEGSKTWRGTIDFVKGAVDAKGDEQENVLLMSPSAVNKSLPVILCDEEAVDGRHGSSIGRIGADILFYMQSRGIDELSAKKIMVKSKVASASRFIQDADVVARINRHLEGAFA